MSKLKGAIIKIVVRDGCLLMCKDEIKWNLMMTLLLIQSDNRDKLFLLGGNVTYK